MNDEIITNLRAAKEKLVQDAGFDLDRLIANIQQEEKQSVMQGRVVLLPSDAKLSGLGFQQIRFANL